MALSTMASTLNFNPFPVLLQAQKNPVHMQQVLELQGKRCAIAGCCEQVLEADHCHKTGKFRGWLCHRHNIMLGWVEATMEENTFSSLMAYLHNPPAMWPTQYTTTSPVPSLPLIHPSQIPSMQHPKLTRKRGGNCKFYFKFCEQIWCDGCRTKHACTANWDDTKVRDVYNRMNSE